MSARQIELLQLRPPRMAPFVLALDPQHDRSIAPHMRDSGMWEPAETQLCERVLRPGMRVIDVGAHVGYYSVLFSRCVGEAGSVDAFEPEPDNFRLLQANLLLNDCRNVRAHAQALTQARSREWLHLCADNPGDHRLAPTPGRRRVEVATLDMDSVLGGTPVDFVKIDTQGAEPRVLAGMDATLHANRDRLACMMEFAPGLLALAGVSLDAYVAQLTALDARVYGISLHAQNLDLCRLVPLRQGLDTLAAALARLGEVDASCDVFAVFGDAAERDWLARFRG
jgi:FkbM family methyltransferase